MGKANRVLVVDDDQDILDLLEYNLERDGFKIKTEVDSQKALTTALCFQPDLIILDIMMPGINGIELCRELRAIPEFKDTYIFFLTANSEANVQQIAIETGGDDLIEKVIGLRELSNKIKAVLKDKWAIHKHKNVVRVGDLKIDRRKGVVHVGGNKIVLSKPEFDLLYFFVQNPRKFIHTRKLLENLWGTNISYAAPSLNYYLANLTRKLDHRLKKITDDTYLLNPSKK